MVYLFLFGSCVEDFIGRVRFALFYLLAGVAAGFVYIAGTPAHFSSEIPMGGASGAISACIGGFVLLLAKTEIEFKWLFILFFRIWTGEFRLPAWVVISFWFGKDLLLAVLTALTSQEGGGVAFAAHVGGFLAGLGWVALEKPRLKRLAEAEEAAEIVERAAAVRARFATQRGNAPIRVRVAEKPTIHLHVAGEQYGPYTLPQILRCRGATSRARRSLLQEGMEEWRPTEGCASRGGLNPAGRIASSKLTLLYRFAASRSSCPAATHRVVDQPHRRASGSHLLTRQGRQSTVPDTVRVPSPLRRRVVPDQSLQFPAQLRQFLGLEGSLGSLQHRDGFPKRLQQHHRAGG